MSTPNIEFLFQNVFEICKDAESLIAFFQAYYNWSVDTKDFERIIKCPDSMEELKKEHIKASKNNKNLVMILPEDKTYAKTSNLRGKNEESFLNDCSFPSGELNDFSPSILFFSKNFLTNAHIVGDIHGDFAGCCEIIFTALEKDKNIVFLGDYVDRGSYSIETLVLVLLLHTIYPKRVVLMRGNHETYYMSLDKDSCKNDMADFICKLGVKYDVEDVKNITKEVAYIFGQMPVAALNHDWSIFLAHAGPPMKHIASKPIDFFNVTNLIQYLWADPYDGAGYMNNEVRGLGFLYGQDTINYKHVIRAHEYVANKDKAINGKVCTIFSTGNTSKHSGYRFGECVDPYIAEVDNENKITLTSVDTKDAIILRELIELKVLLTDTCDNSWLVWQTKKTLTNICKKFGHDRVTLSVKDNKIIGIPENIFLQITRQEQEQFNLQKFLSDYSDEKIINKIII